MPSVWARPRVSPTPCEPGHVSPPCCPPGHNSSWAPYPHIISNIKSSIIRYCTVRSLILLGYHTLYQWLAVWGRGLRHSCKAPARPEEGGGQSLCSACGGQGSRYSDRPLDWTGEAAGLTWPGLQATGLTYPGSHDVISRIVCGGSASPRISEGQDNICPEWGTFCAEASGKDTSASIGGINFKVTGEGGLGAGPRIRNKKFKEEQEI